MTEDFQFRKLSQVRSFRGTFRGKIIKPVDDDDNLRKLEDFEKDDIVWVLKASDFMDFLLTIDKVRNADISELDRIDHELDSMDSRESMLIQLEKALKLLNDISEIKEEKIKLNKRIIKIYNKQLLWLFKVLKDAQTAIIRFDDPNFVDDNIKQLEHEIYFDD